MIYAFIPFLPYRKWFLGCAYRLYFSAKGFKLMVYALCIQRIVKAKLRLDAAARLSHTVAHAAV